MKKNLLIAGAIVGAALMMTGCMGGGRKNAVEQEEKAVLVKVAPAQSETVSETVTYTANLQAYKQNFIVPAMAARIENIYVEVGDKVKEDQLVVDMDKNQLKMYKVQLDNAEATLKRMQPVYESGGISDQQMDELTTNITVLRETVDNLETNLHLKSPISGIITGRYNEEGDLYTMSPNAAGGVGILQVMEMERLKAYVGIPEQYFTQVYMGMPVEIATDVYPGRIFEGKVSRIAPAINASTRTFEVEITIPNAKLELRPGMFARTIFHMSEVEGVTVKDLAIQRQPGTNDKYVFAVENGIAVRKPVITGRQVGSNVEIVSGINEGDTIVVSGMSRVRNGSPVEIID